jgi:hypothetical protein
MNDFKDKQWSASFNAYDRQVILRFEGFAPPVILTLDEAYQLGQDLLSIGGPPMRTK